MVPWQGLELVKINIKLVSECRGINLVYLISEDYTSSGNSGSCSNLPGNSGSWGTDTGCAPPPLK